MPCLTARRFDEALRQTGAFVPRNHPGDHVPAEQIEDHIEGEVDVLRGSLQLGNVPRPDLRRRRRHKLRLGVNGMPRLIAPLPDFVCVGEDAIHRADRAEVRLFLEQRRMDLGGRLIDEPLAAQRVEDVGGRVRSCSGRFGWSGTPGVRERPPAGRRANDPWSSSCTSWDLRCERLRVRQPARERRLLAS
jgi:hypothetical protein